MCNIRGFRHACNHTVYRYISACRGTFADPNSSSISRCLPTASYLINMNDECVQCQYDAFCHDWETRISQAAQRRDVFEAQLNPGHSTHASWASGGRYNNKWSGWNNWSFDLNDAVVIDENYWGDCEDSNDADESLPSIEKSILIKERDEADEETQRLQHQYDTEKWELWQGLLNGSDVKTIQKKANYFSKRRQTSPKINCGSSLRHVENLADLPDPEEPPADVLLFGALELSDDESDCSTTPTLSRSSTVSDDSSEDELEGLSEDTMAEAQKEFRLILDLGGEKRNSLSKFESVGEVEDGADEEMLPVWLECF